MKPHTALSIGIVLGIVVGLWLMQSRGAVGLFTGLAAGLAFGAILARQARP